MNPQRILIIGSFANLGGAQIAALRVARGLRDRGHETRVVFLYEQNAIAAPDHPYEVLLETATPGASGYLRMIRDLIRLTQRERPDIVLTFMPLASIAGHAAALLAGVKRRVISHRVPVWSIKPALRLLDALWAWGGVYTDAIAVSDGVKASCAAYPRHLLKRTVTVHNGIFGWQPSHLTRAEARQKFSIGNEQFALVAVGRLAEQKNYPILLHLMQQAPDALLLIAGEGPLRGQLAGLASALNVAERVRFLGPLPRGEIPDLLAAGDVFVQPSTFEGQSNAILEALQARLPVVAHDIPEQRETIAEDSGAVAGALVPVGDVAGWAAAIEKLRHDSEVAYRAREVAARRADLFTYQRMISGFERVLVRP